MRQFTGQERPVAAWVLATLALSLAACDRAENLGQRLPLRERSERGIAIVRQLEAALDGLDLDDEQREGIRQFGAGMIPEIRHNERPRRPAPIAPGKFVLPQTNDVMPGGEGFYTLHGDVRSADEVFVALAPVLEASWTVETQYYIPEGPTFDALGNVYFTPLLTGADDAPLLVSLDAVTGRRRFAIPGNEVGQGGAPLVLNDPPGDRQVVFTGGYHRIIAVEAATGELVWTTRTGLTSSAAGDDDAFAQLHLYGLNYHWQADAVVGLYANGKVIAIDRQSGGMLGTFDVPGAPARATDPSSQKLRSIIDRKVLARLADRRISREFASFDLRLGGGLETATLVLEALLGGGTKVSNYFSIDPNTGRLWIAGTADDMADGSRDGLADFGALYGIDLERRGQSVEFRPAVRVLFRGGSASTPAIRTDGQRIYVADSFNQVLAFDADGNQLWAVDVGEQVFGSLSVSAVGGEIYAATNKKIVKIVERGEGAEIRWIANLDQIYTRIPRRMEVSNLCVAGIGANGIIVQTGLGIPAGDVTLLPVKMSLTLIDRETGNVINSTEAVEETVSVMAIGPDGTVALANSPVRRAVLRVLTGDALDAIVPQLRGGITKYGVARGYDLLARDAIDAAISVLTAAEADPALARNQVGPLVRQARNAIQQSRDMREMDPASARTLIEQLNVAAAHLQNQDPVRAQAELRDAAGLFGER